MDRRDRGRHARRGALGDPARLGLDAVFPAFYLSLFAEEARCRRAVAAAAVAIAVRRSMIVVVVVAALTAAATRALFS